MQSKCTYVAELIVFMVFLANMKGLYVTNQTRIQVKPRSLDLNELLFPVCTRINYSLACLVKLIIFNIKYDLVQAKIVV